MNSRGRSSRRNAGGSFLWVGFPVSPQALHLSLTAALHF